MTTENELRAIINMDAFGGAGLYPDADGTTLDTPPHLRHFAGLFPFATLSTSSVVGITDDGDILMTYEPIEGGKITIESEDLVRDKGLRTAVLISLLTDRVAETTDVLPDNTGERRGYWDDPELGSRLWLLFRSALTTDVPDKIERFSRQALEWMIEDGVAADIIVTAERTDVFLVEWEIQIIKPGGENSDNFKFFFNWENEVFGGTV